MANGEEETVVTRVQRNEQYEPDCQAEQPSSPLCDVNISKVSNGFIVIVGCATFVSQDWREIADGLALYWKDPAKAQEKYYKT